MLLRNHAKVAKATFFDLKVSDFYHKLTNFKLYFI